MQKGILFMHLLFVICMSYKSKKKQRKSICLKQKHTDRNYPMCMPMQIAVYNASDASKT